MRWTEDMWNTAQRLRREGLGYLEIGKVLGLSRYQVKDRFWHVSMPDHIRERRNAQGRERRSRERRAAGIPRRERVSTPLQPDMQALAERNMRLAVAPRDLTAALMGDPRPGWSALEGRG